MADEPAACLRWYRRPGSPRFTLVALPHAGGNATAFRGWTDHLPDGVALAAARHPGRLDRLREPPAGSIAELADPLAAAVGRIAGPVVLFGHSLGAVVAHEVTARLERDRRPPQLLVVSGREAPQFAVPVPVPDGDQLIARYLGLGGIPPEVLGEPELLELVLDPLRADLTLLNGYLEKPVERPAGPVSADIVAYRATADRGCSPAQIDGWKSFTRGGFRRVSVVGDHFSVVARPGEMLNDLCTRV